MNNDTLLFRQINPDWIQDDGVTSQAFTPTPKDKRKLSVYDGDQITPEASWRHFHERQGLVSVGVLAVTAGECLAQNTSVQCDPKPYREHVVIDFSDLTSASQRKNAAKQLREVALMRGWQYRPNS